MAAKLNTPKEKSIITDLDVESEISHAYLHAVASHAGLVVFPTNRAVDNLGYDVSLIYAHKHKPYHEIEIKVQLKATTTPLRIIQQGKNQNKIPFAQFPVKTYNKFSYSESPSHSIAVVLFLPKNKDEWVIHTDESLMLQRRAYWVSLRGAPPTDNKKNVTIYFPQENVLNQANLLRLAQSLANDERRYYNE